MINVLSVDKINSESPYYVRQVTESRLCVVVCLDIGLKGHMLSYAIQQ